MRTTVPSSTAPRTSALRTLALRTTALRTRVRDRVAAHRWALERVAAPHVEERWAEQLVLQLRLRGVSGAGIGAALAEVDSHCAESGSTAADDFGDPVDYARSLELPTAADLSPRDLVRAAAPTAVQVLGMLLVVWAVPSLRRGAPVDVTTGHLVLVAVLAAEIALVVGALDVVLTTVTNRPVLTWAVATATLGVPVAVLLLLDDAVLTAPAQVTVGAGSVLVLAGAVAAHRLRQTDAAAGDPVVPPLPRPGSRRDRLGAVVASGGVWLVPVWTVVLATSGWMIG